MVWKFRKSCFYGLNIDDCKVLFRIYLYIYVLISCKNCYEKGKFV